MTTLDEDRPVGTTSERAHDSPVDVPVSAHRSAPGRTVFVEDGNNDAWIASDTTVDLDP